MPNQKELQSRFGLTEDELKKILSDCQLDPNKQQLNEGEYQQVLQYVQNSSTGKEDNLTQLANNLEQLNDDQVQELLAKLKNKGIQRVQQIEEAFDRMFMTKFAAKVNSGELAQAIKEETEKNMPPPINILTVVEARLEQERLQSRSTNKSLPPTEH